MLVVLGYRREKSKSLSLVESIERSWPQLVVGVELLPQFRHVELKWDLLTNGHYQAFYLLECFEINLFDGGQVVVNHHCHHLALAEGKSC